MYICKVEGKNEENNAITMNNMKLQTKICI